MPDEAQIGEIKVYLYDPTPPRPATGFSQLYADHPAVEARGRKHVRLVVENYGVGIDPSELERVFERWFRGSWRDSKLDRPGSGLGLYIVKGLVACHGGSVSAWASPRPGGEHKSQSLASVAHVVRLVVTLPRTHKLPNVPN